MQHGFRVPGNGCIISSIDASLKQPGGEGLICEKVCVGKPNPGIIDLIRKQHGIPESDLSKMIMFGDRPNTDI
jgi:ribonucleotide monophosphatase NagD (HAD superfamily)